MKSLIAALFFLLSILSLQAQELSYHQIVCFSDSDGWIKILVNKNQPNDQLLYIYHQGGTMGPGNLQASYPAVGTRNMFAIDDNGKIYLQAQFTMGLSLTMEYSIATLRSTNGDMPINYRTCRLK